MRTNRIVFLMLTTILTGCGVTGAAGAIQKASKQVVRAYDASYEQVYANPVSLRVRLNPCACDEVLEFEAEIYGNWRHVFVKGSNEDLARLRKEGAQAGTGSAFEASFLLHHELYNSASGQQFFVLEIE